LPEGVCFEVGLEFNIDSHHMPGGPGKYRVVGLKPPWTRKGTSEFIPEGLVERLGCMDGPSFEFDLACMPGGTCSV
jgi:hypothetical protein